MCHQRHLWASSGHVGATTSIVTAEVSLRDARVWIDYEAAVNDPLDGADSDPSDEHAIVSVPDPDLCPPVVGPVFTVASPQPIVTTALPHSGGAVGHVAFVVDGVFYEC